MTKKVKVGDVYIGGGERVTVQSMTNTLTSDVENTVTQIRSLEQAGCDIVRITVNTDAAANSVKSIVDSVDIPIVADIHFDYKLAIKSIENGVSKLRFNPGNIGDLKNVAKIADCAKQHNVPIRVGVNGGSIEKDILKEFGRSPKALVESAMRHVRLLENEGFYNTVISVKSSSPKITVDAYRMLTTVCDYPLHIGVTEAGLDDEGIYKSITALGSLLLDGIGDTVRVSLTGDPIREVEVAQKLLRAVGIEKDFVEVVSCPTCGRCSLDLERIVREVRSKTINIRKPLKIAIMGCVVNGLGEAGDSDFGIAGGKDKSTLFVKGQIIKTIPNYAIVDELLRLCGEFTNER